MAVTHAVCLPRHLGAGFLAAGVCFGFLMRVPAAASDLYGDALPEGAVARLGTTRLRALCDSVRFSPDGKTLLGVKDRYLVRVWDAAEGNLLKTSRLFDPTTKHGETFRTPQVGDTLLVSDGTALEVWDLSSGKRLDLRLPRARKRFDCGTLSSDHRLLFFGEMIKERFISGNGHDSSLGRIEQVQHLVLWDTKLLGRRLLAEDESGLVCLAVSPDGKWLASSSYGKGTRVWEAATGKLLWQDPKFNAETIAFTADSRRLIAAPGGGQSAWHVWDVTTGRPSKEYRAPTVGYVWTFALSPDGRKLLAPTVTDYVLWDLPGGRELHRWPGAKQAGKVAFAPDGRSVVTADTVLRRWDVATGKPLYRDVSRLGHTAAVRHLFFTPDGQRLVSVGEDARIRVWDVAASKPLHTLDTEAPSVNAWAMTPDGALLLGVDEDLIVHRWSVAEGRSRGRHRLAEAQALNIHLRARCLRVTPDAGTLVLSAWPREPEYRFRPYTFSFWDLKTGRLSRWGGDPGREYSGDRAILSPDGRFAEVDGELCDTRTGERRWTRSAGGGDAVFSPDGRLLATKAKGWHVRESASGQALIDLTDAPMGRGAFSSDDTRFAAAEGCRLVIYGLRGPRAVRRRSETEITSGVAFSPDGHIVATGHRDGTILLWDAPSLTKPEGRLSEGEAAARWDDLAGRASDAWIAVWRFHQDSGAAVRLLRKRLPPVPGPTDDEWQALIRQLDSEQFEGREAASRRLAKLGRAAESVLRQARRNKPTPEQKRRIEDLLNALEPPARLPLSDPRVIRAVAILEGSNTSEARRLLEAWANGLSAAPLREEAARALARLKWRPAMKPDR